MFLSELLCCLVFKKYKRLLEREMFTKNVSLLLKKKCLVSVNAVWKQNILSAALTPSLLLFDYQFPLVTSTSLVFCRPFFLSEVALYLRRCFTGFVAWVFPLKKLKKKRRFFLGERSIDVMY